MLSLHPLGIWSDYLVHLPQPPQPHLATESSPEVLCCHRLTHSCLSNHTYIYPVQNLQIRYRCNNCHHPSRISPHLHIHILPKGGNNRQLKDQRVYEGFLITTANMRERDLLKQALESNKTQSRKARTRIASGASSKTNSAVNSPAQSRATSRNPSRQISDDDDAYLSDDTAWR